MSYPSYDYTLNAYQKDALQTAGKHQHRDSALANWALGLSGEAGEFADEVKKALFHDKPLDRERLQKELGDVLWYLAVAARELGYDLEDVARVNIAKLRQRHGESFKPHGEQSR